MTWHENYYVLSTIFSLFEVLMKNMKRKKKVVFKKSKSDRDQKGVFEVLKSKMDDKNNLNVDNY